MSFSSFNGCTPSVVHHQNGKEKLDAHRRMIYGMGEHRSRLFLLLSSLDLPHHHPFSPPFPGRLERTDLKDVTSILASLFSYSRDIVFAKSSSSVHSKSLNEPTTVSTVQSIDIKQLRYTVNMTSKGKKVRSSSVVL